MEQRQPDLIKKKSKPQTGKDNTKFQITISKDLKFRMNKLAKTKELPMSRLVSMAVADYVAANEKHLQAA